MRSTLLLLLLFYAADVVLVGELVDWVILWKKSCFATSSKAIETFSPFFEEVSKYKEQPFSFIHASAF